MKVDRKSLFSGVRRVVVKVGTGVLTTSNNRLDTSYIEELVEQVVYLKKKKIDVALVTSGAIVAGVFSLGLKKRPRQLSKLQAAASIGQTSLMRIYERLFKERGFSVGQVLLTRDVLEEGERRQNAKNTLLTLFKYGVIPVVNENDTVAVEEIKFGDNDNLSALLTLLVDANLLIILSDVDGLYTSAPHQKKGKLIPLVEKIDNKIESLKEGKSNFGIGGMATKIEAAKLISSKGKCTIIANGREKNVLRRIFSGEEIGTLFLPWT